MPSLRPQDRASLCRFTFTDGRKCLTPRAPTHQHFCYFHARKESRSTGTEKLAQDVAYFFSGNYLSANDLNAAIGRLFPAVIRGDLKPRTAGILAYLAQTLAQTIPLSKHEYIYAFGDPAWGNAVRNSVNQNFKYKRTPAPPNPAFSAAPEPRPQSAPTPAQSQPEPHPTTSIRSERSSCTPPEPSSATVPPNACHPERSEACAPQAGNAFSTSADTAERPAASDQAQNATHVGAELQPGQLVLEPSRASTANSDALAPSPSPTNVSRISPEPARRRPRALVHPDQVPNSPPAPPQPSST